MTTIYPQPFYSDALRLPEKNLILKNAVNSYIERYWKTTLGRNEFKA